MDSPLVTLAVILLGSYLLGSIPFGYLAGRLAGLDIRKFGSGNVGATNVVRILGKKYGYPVFALDLLKGFGSVKLATIIAAGQKAGGNSAEILGIAAAIASIIGHSYPVWLKFKGGKGVATSAGALFALTPLGGAIGVAIWSLTFFMTGYVSVASITVSVLLPLVLLAMSCRGENTKIIFYFSVCIAAIVIWRHRSNLSRLIHGTETRFDRK